MTTPKKSKLYVFIDGENLHRCFRAMGYKNVDYVKLFWWLRKNKGAIKIFLYVGLLDGDIQRAAIYKGLQKLGYDVKIKPVQQYHGDMRNVSCKCPKCAHEYIMQEQMPDRSKANCDAELTVDVTRMCLTNKCDEVMIFSGDGDFGYLYEFVVGDLHKKVSVYAPLRHPASLQTSSRLKDLDRDGCINLYNLESVAQHRNTGALEGL
jgi:uncharacterized LabA/DUF88 family protein